MKKYDYIIGIDTGVNTGFAIWDCEQKKLVQLHTIKIHDAIERVYNWSAMNVLVRVEDARLRKWFNKSGPEKLQGAGSIKRDAKIWEDYLTDKNIPFELVAPKNNCTKLSAEIFKSLTGWENKTTEHSRDAAMLVYAFN